jgi:hypothetical protein
MHKSKPELSDLCQSCEIITEDKHVKFQLIPFRTFGDTNLYETKCDRDRHLLHLIQFDIRLSFSFFYQMSNIHEVYICRHLKLI